MATSGHHHHFHHHCCGLRMSWATRVWYNWSSASFSSIIHREIENGPKKWCDDFKKVITYYCLGIYRAYCSNISSIVRYEICIFVQNSKIGLFLLDFHVDLQDSINFLLPWYFLCRDFLIKYKFHNILQCY